MDGQTNAPQSSLFREAAVDRANSPEQLDQRIRLVPPAMRLAAIAATLIIAAGLVWGVFGTIPTRTGGSGVLLSDGKGSYAVEPAASGPVIELLARRGDHVKAGAVIARIKQASLSAQVDGTAARLSAMEENLARQQAADAAILAKSEDTTRRQLAAIDQQITAAKARIDRLSKLLEGYESLETRGLLTASSLVNMQQEFDQTVLNSANANARRIEVEALLDQKREEFAERQRQARVAIDAVKADLDRVKADLAIGATVTAPVAGTIDEVRVGLGDVVSPGTVIATIGEVSEVPRFEVVAFFGGEMGKRVTKGMPVHVHPVTVRREEHGAMRGTIEDVTERSVSEPEVDAILRNLTLTRTLMGKGAPIMARISLIEDKHTPSGFAWWIGNGPPYKVTRGTLIEADVIVNERRPIDLVVPALRRLLGIPG